MKGVAFVLLVLTVVSSCAMVSSPLAGRWKGKDSSGGDVVLFLERNGSFEALSGGERLAGKWVLHDDTEPHRIDFIFETRTVSSILAVEGDRLIIEPVGNDGPPPTQFSDKATSYQRQP